MARWHPGSVDVYSGGNLCGRVADYRSADQLDRKLWARSARELRARGADMDWDQAVTYTLTQTTQALIELQSGTQP
jgi:hypothetical protein